MTDWTPPKDFTERWLNEDWDDWFEGEYCEAKCPDLMGRIELSKQYDCILDKGHQGAHRNQFNTVWSSCHCRSHATHEDCIPHCYLWWCEWSNDD